MLVVSNEIQNDSKKWIENSIRLSFSHSCALRWSHGFPFLWMRFFLMNVHVWSPIKGFRTKRTLIQFPGVMSCHMLLEDSIIEFAMTMNEIKNNFEQIPNNYFIRLSWLQLFSTYFTFDCPRLMHHFNMSRRRGKLNWIRNSVLRNDWLYESMSFTLTGSLDLALFYRTVYNPAEYSRGLSWYEISKHFHFCTSDYRCYIEIVQHFLLYVRVWCERWPPLPI